MISSLEGNSISLAFEILSIKPRRIVQREVSTKKADMSLNKKVVTTARDAASFGVATFKVFLRRGEDLSLTAIMALPFLLLLPIHNC